MLLNKTNFHFLMILGSILADLCNFRISDELKIAENFNNSENVETSLLAGGRLSFAGVLH